MSHLSRSSRDDPSPETKTRLLERHRWLGWDKLWILIALSCVFLVRANLEYRPFPSVDDFAYVPLAWHWLNPSLFSTDDLLTGFGNHQIAYAAVVAAAEATLGLSWSFFLMTLLLTALTLFALARLMRTLGAAGYLLPFAIALSATIVVRGLGRGNYDGLIGDAMHGQWIAIVLSLFAFDTLLRGKPMVAGILLGLAAYGQAMLAFHSALAILIAGVFLGRAGLQSTLRAGAAAIVVSLPLLYTLASALLQEGNAAGPADWNAIAETYLFRAPHHYDLELYPVALGVLLVITGVSAFARFADMASPRDRLAAGLYLGMSLLFLASVLVYWIFREVIPPDLAVVAYVLDLTRSSPLLFAFAGVFVAVAIERDLAGTRGGATTPAWGRLTWLFALISILVLLATNMRHDPWVYAGLTLSLVTVLAFRLSLPPLVAAASWLVAGALAANAYFGTLQLDAEVSPEEKELYTWAKVETPPSALFIVPPGFQEFRTHALRSVYAEFKIASMAQPQLLVEWKERLTHVANPDRLAQIAKGWDGIAEWDRSYAARNPPERIESLLRSTRSDFFVLDKEGLKIPPFVDREPKKSADIATAFENERFTVYRLQDDAGS